MTREQKIEEARKEYMDAYWKSQEIYQKYREIEDNATDDPEPPEIPERIKWLREGWRRCASYFLCVLNCPEDAFEEACKQSDIAITWPEVKA